jgi:cytochrome c oxidase subunit 1
MGAVYALLGGFYYWVGKITGYQYNEVWGQIHFWIFTIAINLVFFPMHFLGMAGLPRRIPDYPDGYEYWNSFMTLGSFLTFFSLVIFLFNIASIVSTNQRQLPVFSLLLFCLDTKRLRICVFSFYLFVNKTLSK